MLLNYVKYLISKKNFITINYSLENKYYEEAFRMFEKSLSLFNWPSLYNI